MKLLRLKITDTNGFRSLQPNFEMYFLRDFDYDEATDFNPYVLAGRNGSGKSNILEALAEIFFHLDCIYLRNKPQYFDASEENENGFKPENATIDAYELEYFTFLDSEQFVSVDTSKNAHISITKKPNERPKIQWVNEEVFRKPQALSQLEVKTLLPEYVVGYASGNNETLSLPFFKSRFLQYDAYLSSLQAEEFVDPKPENSLVYLDEQYSQAILLTNLLMWDTEKHPNILQPFEKYVNLEGLESFRLMIRTDKEIEVPKDFSFNSGTVRPLEIKPIKLLQNLDIKNTTDSSFIRSYLEKLQRCATAWQEYHVYDSYPEFDDSDEHFEGTSYLILDFKVNEATKKAFQFHFEYNPLKLFELFQLLLVLNNHEVSFKRKQRLYASTNLYISRDITQLPVEEHRILRFKDFKIRKKGVTNTIFTKALSDGEHQFLHSLGLCLLFKDTRSLFLLDEPETHFNPGWKAQFISSIRNCFQKEEEDASHTMREMLITTHSPFLISDSKMEYVQVFRKNEESGKVEEVVRPEFQTFGTSVNRIAIRMFGMPNTIGAYAQQRLDEFKAIAASVETPEDIEQLIRNVKNELGDSVERIVFVNELIEKLERL